MKKYKAVYTDKYKKEDIEILSNGSVMSLTLRGIEFEGIDFEGLTGKVDNSKFKYDMCQDGVGDLTDFRVEVQFPIKINHKDNTTIETIRFVIDVGDTSEIKGLEPVANTVELSTSFGKFKSNKKVEFFEDSIIEIQNMLSSNTKIQSCISCKYSNYHPVGNGMFGSLYCFKKMKSTLKTVTNKYDLMDIWTDEAINNGTIFNVQEIYECEEHVFIGKDDWTYKNWE